VHRIDREILKAKTTNTKVNKDSKLLIGGGQLLYEADPVGDVCMGLGILEKTICCTSVSALRIGT
jgi:hypothetical protein